MKRFTNILVVQDGSIGSEAALRRAETLAEAHGAKLTVGEVLRQFPGGNALDLLAEREATVRSRYREERQARLRRLAAPARQAGIATGTLLIEGVGHVEIVRAVERHRYDLVIVTEGIRSLRTMAFGSTAGQLVRNCACPVWVVKSRPPRQVCRVAAVVTGFAEDDLDREVLGVAASLARAEGCGLDVFSAWEFAGRELETASSECADAHLEVLYREGGKAHERAVRALIAGAGLRGLKWRVAVHKGDAETGLATFAEENDTDLVVLGIHPRRGLAGLVGSRAEKMLGRLGCSLVGVKPCSFETPFELRDPRAAPRERELSAAE